jgi:hypothetical protein
MHEPKFLEQEGGMKTLDRIQLCTRASQKKCDEVCNKEALEGWEVDDDDVIK